MDRRTTALPVAPIPRKWCRRDHVVITPSRGSGVFRTKKVQEGGFVVSRAGGLVGEASRWNACLTARSVRRPRYTEATTSQSRDRRRAVSRCCFGACTNVLLVSRTDQRWPKWSLRSTRQTDPCFFAVYRPG